MWNLCVHILVHLNHTPCTDSFTSWGPSYSCLHAALHPNDMCWQLVNSWNISFSTRHQWKLEGVLALCIQYVHGFVNVITWACTVCSCFSRLRRASSSSSCCSSKVFFSTSSWRIWPLRFSFWRVSSCRSSYIKRNQKSESQVIWMKGFDEDSQLSRSYSTLWIN